MRRPAAVTKAGALNRPSNPPRQGEGWPCLDETRLPVLLWKRGVLTDSNSLIALSDIQSSGEETKQLPLIFPVGS